jgi:hypothetical protein
MSATYAGNGRDDLCSWKILWLKKVYELCSSLLEYRAINANPATRTCQRLHDPSGARNATKVGQVHVVRGKTQNTTYQRISGEK